MPCDGVKLLIKRRWVFIAAQLAGGFNEAVVLAWGRFILTGHEQALLVAGVGQRSWRTVNYAIDTQESGRVRKVCDPGGT